MTKIQGWRRAAPPPPSCGGAEALAGREQALAAPFWVACLGVMIVNLAGWRALGRGLAG